MASIPVIHTRRLTLRPLRPDDLTEVARWSRDGELAALFGGSPLELARLDYGPVQAIDAGGRLVGLIGLTADAWGMGSAELRILIGPAPERGKGYGTEAVSALLDHLASETGLDFIFLRVFAHNPGAIRCYEKCGFERAGRLRVGSDSRYSDPPPRDDLLLMTVHLRSLERRGLVTGAQTRETAATSR